jgi:phosphatidyl-myo-inositol alpha-mannosyltransferase
MRVGLVCPYSLDVHGGVQNHVRDLAESLLEHGHDVSVLAPGEQAPDMPAYVSTVGRAVPVPYNGSVARVSFGPLVAARVKRWLDGGGFDVLHIHEPATPSVSVLALWSARAPVVATYHTAQERPRALETSAATFLRGGLEKIDAHIAVSEAAAATLGRYQDVTPAVIPNGVRIERYRNDRDRVDGRSAAEPKLVFVGRADEPRKGFKVLLRAMPLILERHPGARLAVIGATEVRGRSERELLRKIAHRVELRGVVDERTKARILADADLLVAPNTGGESFGIVLVEAMAAGLPVVASDLPAFGAVLGEDGGRLFPVGDHEALAEVVDGLLADHELRSGLGCSAARVADGFDWSRLTPQVVDVYDSVAGLWRGVSGT